MRFKVKVKRIIMFQAMIMKLLPTQSVNCNEETPINKMNEDMYVNSLIST